MPSEISNELHTAVQKDDMEAVDEILANNPGALAETTQVTYMYQCCQWQWHGHHAAVFSRCWRQVLCSPCACDVTHRCIHCCGVDGHVCLITLCVLHVLSVVPFLTIISFVPHVWIDCVVAWLLC